ncbi:Uncharacterised protein [Lysinibacillus capsici]|uniref:Uncharacterized protein n=1 Tax=Lysinibacillus capsici TaxID=2115968 RepID=A0A2X0XMS0_9BACI|nr:Uncharacterised protein [Lysinibacillus capsici]
MLTIKDQSKYQKIIFHSNKNFIERSVLGGLLFFIPKNNEKIGKCGIKKALGQRPSAISAIAIRNHTVSTGNSKSTSKLNLIRILPPP